MSPTTHTQQQTRTPSPNEASPTRLAVSNFRQFSSGTASDENMSNQESRRRDPLAHGMYQDLLFRGDSHHHDQKPPGASDALARLSEEKTPLPTRASITDESKLSLVQEKANPPFLGQPRGGVFPWTSQTHTLPAIDSSRVLPMPSLLAGPSGGPVHAWPLESSLSFYHQSRKNPTADNDDASKSSIAALLRAGEQLDREDEQLVTASDVSSRRGRY